ncbi:hypothetical protein SNL152K_2577 [Streptomyces sp. NL15-2K]|nr:hypothetical protein SNL152K_2577 [Streptomyces sp. NL15-2K]
MQLLVAAHATGRVPRAAGSALRSAQDGVARGQIHTEPAVAAADEPVAVHQFTLSRGEGGARSDPRLSTVEARSGRLYEKTYERPYQTLYEKTYENRKPTS